MVFLSQDSVGRQFISVLDLEDQDLHHDLPPHVSPEVQDALPICPSSPTSAQLHILATSVIRSTAVPDPQPSVTVTMNHPEPTTYQGFSFISSLTLLSLFLLLSKQNICCVYL